MKKDEFIVKHGKERYEKKVEEKQGMDNGAPREG